MNFQPTAAEVRAMREELGIGIFEVKKILIGRKLRAACASPWIEDQRVAAILLQIVNDHYPEDVVPSPAELPVRLSNIVPHSEPISQDPLTRAQVGAIVAARDAEQLTRLDAFKRDQRLRLKDTGDYVRFEFGKHSHPGFIGGPVAVVHRDDDSLEQLVTLVSNLESISCEDAAALA